MNWYDDLGERYDTWSSSMTEDIAFYIELALAADGPVVELAVGAGRVAIPVARAIGRPVLGIDTSAAMLDIAHRAAGTAGLDLDLRLADMRTLELARPAALIYCPYRSLLHLPTWADRRQTFVAVAAALRPGGRFAWNAFAHDPHLAVQLDGRHQDLPVPHTVHYIRAPNRIDIVLDDGPTTTLHWATLNEWLGLIECSGLVIEHTYGGFDHQPLADDSTEYVFVCRRPDVPTTTVETPSRQCDPARSSRAPGRTSGRSE
jgi:SAM-dependent methyltransferase